MRPDRNENPMYEQEPCFDCDGEGCSTCGFTGWLYTEAAIELQVEAREREQVSE